MKCSFLSLKVDVRVRYSTFYNVFIVFEINYQNCIIYAHIIKQLLVAFAILK